MGVLDVVGDIIGIGADVSNSIFQWQNYDYQRRMQRKAWEREDTAVSRRVADLRAAGLSPTLAAGSAAASSAASILRPPQVNLENTLAALNMRAVKAQISKTEADTRLTEAQAEGQGVANRYAKYMNPLKFEAQQLENQLRKLVNPETVFQAIKRSATMNVEYETALAERDLRRIGVDLARLDREVRTVAKDVAQQYGLQQAQAELILKLVTASVANHNLEWATEHGIPTGQPGGVVGELMRGHGWFKRIGEMIGEALNWGKRK